MDVEAPSLAHGKRRKGTYVSFDPVEHREYVTGFAQRKAKRRKEALEGLQRKEKERRLAARQARREAKRRAVAEREASQRQAQEDVRASLEGSKKESTCDTFAWKDGLVSTVVTEALNPEQVGHQTAFQEEEKEWIEDEAQDEQGNKEHAKGSWKEKPKRNKLKPKEVKKQLQALLGGTGKKKTKAKSKVKKAGKKKKR
mmetsp:Transcript_1119/g.7205  ORF Transcript_1119/g.7205 Transcript_1119/m.7205 type:complete len:199 (+) Transcript_1119:2220-2816(+)